MSKVCLVENLHSSYHRPGDAQLSTALWSADALLKLLHGANMFLSPEEQEQKEVIGDLFMKTYVGLASEAVAAGRKMYRTRPKMHLFHHLIVERRASRRNPVMGATWMDEDFIKRCFRLKKRVHKRNATLNVLRRWLMGLPVQIRKVFANSGWQIGWKKKTCGAPVVQHAMPWVW